MATTTIQATCACKIFSINVSFPNSALPFNRALCLCTTCRRVSGSCGNSYIPLPASTPPIDLDSFDLTAYNTSDDLIRYFCSTCSAHIFVYRIKDKTWHLATGIWDRTERIINWTGCKWVEDTIDGGVSIWFNEIEDSKGKRKLKRWMLRDGDGDTVQEGTLEHLSPKQKIEGEEERLQAQCHCGGVKFYITRPNEQSKKAYSPFPDLMIPFHAGASAANSSHEPWFLRSNNTKYLAGTCTCPSCRHSLGFEIQTWAFIPKLNIFQGNGQPSDFNNLGTLKQYKSSKGVTREFCGKCGANIFWHCEERPELIDVSVGVLDPNEGARVEGWLDWWTGRVSFEEGAVSRCLVGSLERGLKEWGEKRQGV